MKFVVGCKKKPQYQTPLWCILPQTVEDIEQGKRLAPIPTDPHDYSTKPKGPLFNGKAWPK